MKKIIFIACLLIAAALFAFFKLNKSIKIPTFIGLKSAEVNSFDKKESVIDLVLTLKNDNVFSAQLINSDVSAFNNDVQIAKISQTKIIEIPALSEFDLNFALNINHLKILEAKGISGLIEQLLDSKKPLVVNFKGYCNVKVNDKIYKIPIDFKEEIYLDVK